MDFSKYLSSAGDFLIYNTPKVLWAVALLYIWLRIIGKVHMYFVKFLEKSKVDEMVAKFLANILSVCMKIMLLVVVTNILGIETTSFIALLWAAWLAVWLSLQWSLSNLAGWVLLILNKPFEIGDMIEIEWATGKVLEIDMYVTKISTLDKTTIIIPNGTLMNWIIKNYTDQPIKRVDISFSIQLDEDIAQTRKVLLAVAEQHPLILKDPITSLVVDQLDGKGVHCILMVYVATEYYKQVFYDMTEKVKYALEWKDIDMVNSQSFVTMVEQKEMH